MKKINVMLGIIMCFYMMSSCKKDTKSDTYPINVRMTDAPGPYNAVYVDIVGVEVTRDNGNTVLLNVNQGVYNLLNFTNGMDTLIASASLENASVEQIRLILGSNNSVVVDGVSFPLSTPSAEQSGLKLQVHQTLQAGVLYSVLLDFDVNKSIVLLGNGTYKLKPVIRTIETAISGAIKGKITPVGTLAYVTATSADTYSSFVSTSGSFLVKGLPAGIYSVTISPASPFIETTRSNIPVIIGNTTDVGTINL